MSVSTLKNKVTVTFYAFTDIKESAFLEIGAQERT